MGEVAVACPEDQDSLCGHLGAPTRVHFCYSCFPRGKRKKTHPGTHISRRVFLIVCAMKKTSRVLCSRLIHGPFVVVAAVGLLLHT